MILPIIAYGDTILKKKTEAIPKDYPRLAEIIIDMFDTMYQAKGVGLAAPQIGLSIRLFVVDAAPFAEDDEVLKNFKRVFINTQMVKEVGAKWKFNEGCLSIPGVREDVFRKQEIEIEYMDENFVKHKEEFDGTAARIIQHEYDHIEGVLFTDRISAMRRQLIRGSLKNISIGDVEVDYKMRFPVKKSSTVK
ncbi:MAG TPA: peptide deformylase [Bacteroidia bacterium]|nr:peptide deformylase [Bacteroidia bacterium]